MDAKNPLAELLDVLERSFAGVFPNAPAELLARSVASACLPDENPESLAQFVNLLIPAIERRMAKRHVNARLAELDAEITSLRGKIRRNLADQAMYPRIFWNLSQSEREAELSQIRDERTRLESALFNLVKEQRELKSGK